MYVKDRSSYRIMGCSYHQYFFQFKYICICRLENIYYKLKIFTLLTKYIYGLCEVYLTFIEYISTD